MRMDDIIMISTVPSFQNETCHERRLLYSPHPSLVVFHSYSEDNPSSFSVIWLIDMALALNSKDNDHRKKQQGNQMQGFGILTEGQSTLEKVNAFTGSSSIPFTLISLMSLFCPQITTRCSYPDGYIA
jgi:hypothetical protein